jgi:DNA primase catalytic core
VPDIFNIVKEAIAFERYCDDRGLIFDGRKKAICPFHDDNNPSFHNYDTHGFCFACGKHADIIDLEAHFKGLSPWEAALSLANEYSVPLPELSPKDKVKFNKRLKANELLERFITYANNRIKRHPEVMEFLKNKGLDENDTVYNSIGYIGDNNPVATNLKDETDIEIALEIGLIHKIENGDYYDHFRNRIIMPILKHGKAVFLTGRTFPDSTIRENSPKYLHLKTSDLIHKEIYLSENLNKDYCIIVEGVFDAIALDKAGFNACALLGTNPGEHARNELLQSKSKKYVAFDSDDAGKKASYNLAKELRGSNLNTGYKEDFDELLVKHGLNEFREIITKSKNEATHYLDAIIESEDIRIAKEEIAKLDDECERDIYIGKLHERHKDKGIKKTSIDADIRKIQKEIKSDIQPLEIRDEGNKNYTASFKGLVDLVEHEGKIAFLVKKGNQLEIKDHITINGDIYYPPPTIQKHLPTKFSFPRASEVIRYYKEDNDLQLYHDLFEYHKRISELPDDESYDLLTTWDFHTYTLDKNEVQYSPFIELFAIPERGKSRTGKGAAYVSYRGIHIENLREANLIRMANDWQATLFVDVMDLWKKAEKEGSIDILLHRYEKGATVGRVLNPEKGAFEDITYYGVFGATIIGSNKPIHEIMETRSVLIPMPESEKEFEIDVTPELGLPYKERLVAFRARNIDKALPEIKKPIKGRLGDILKPLLQTLLLVNPDKEKVFRQLILRLDSERKANKSDTFEAKLISAIAEFKEDYRDGDKLHVKSITEKYNESVKEKYHVSENKVGWTLKSMSFKKGKDSTAAYMVWNTKLINQLSDKYGLTLNETHKEAKNDIPQNTPPHGEKKRHDRQERHLFNNDNNLEYDDLNDDLSTTSEDHHTVSGYNQNKNDDHDDVDDLFRGVEGNYSQGNEMVNGKTGLCTGCWKIRIACICN